MKIQILPLILLLVACKPESKPDKPIIGTWKMISGTIIKGGDTTVTDYTKGVSFIKIINDTHFSFVLHDVNGGKDSLATYSSGAGKYDLVNDNYTEHLEYCTAREWEGHDFSFKITIRNDTLTQQGLEEIETAGISQMNIEKYVRIKN